MPRQNRKQAYEDALEEYAKVIGGTTWLGRYGPLRC